MIKVAITGNIASGKSQTEAFFLPFCGEIYDTDKIVHNLYQNKSFLSQIPAKFNPSEFIENLQINRQKLAEKFFNNEKFKKEFENFIHPIVWEKIEEIFEQNKNKKFTFISIPQLFECGWQNKFDKIILITAPENVRIERLIARNGLSKEEAQKRINTQIKEEEKIKYSDFIIENNSTLDDLKVDTERVWTILNE